MQRLSTTALSIVLLFFTMAVSLALISAAWFMVSSLLNGYIFSLPTSVYSFRY